jgi:hypothetical protein
VVHVVEKVGGGRLGDADTYLNEDRTLAKLRAQTSALRRHGFDASLHLIRGAAGQPARQIAATAAQVGADLVIVGTRGRSPAAGALLGSVTQRLLHQHLPRPRRALSVTGRRRVGRVPQPSRCPPGLKRLTCFWSPARESGSAWATYHEAYAPALAARIAATYPERWRPPGRRRVPPRACWRVPRGAAADPHRQAGTSSREAAQLMLKRDARHVIVIDPDIQRPTDVLSTLVAHPWPVREPIRRSHGIVTPGWGLGWEHAADDRELRPLGCLLAGGEFPVGRADLPA